MGCVADLVVDSVDRDAPCWRSKRWGVLHPNAPDCRRVSIEDLDFENRGEGNVPL